MLRDDVVVTSAKKRRAKGALTTKPMVKTSGCCKHSVQQRIEAIVIGRGEQRSYDVAQMSGIVRLFIGIEIVAVLPRGVEDHVVPKARALLDIVAQIALAFARRHGGVLGGGESRNKAGRENVEKQHHIDRAVAFGVADRSNAQRPVGAAIEWGTGERLEAVTQSGHLGSLFIRVIGRPIAPAFMDREAV